MSVYREPADVELDAPNALVLRDIGIEVRGVDEGARTCNFIASTDAIDAYDEIVEQDWILERFKTNPVILFAHNSRELPIGRAIRCEVVTDIRGTRLECTVEFATKDMNPDAERVWQMVKGGFLRAVSVGFRPKSVRYEKRNGQEVYVLSKNVLHEISVVTIPANPEALAKSDPLAKMKALAKAAGSEETAPPPALDPVRQEAFAKAKADAERANEEPLTPASEGASGQEKSMTLEEMQKAIDAEKTKAAEAQGQIASLTERATKAEDRVKAAEEAVEAQKSRAEAAEKSVETLRSDLTASEEIVRKSIAALGGAKAKLDDKGEPMKNEKGEPIVETAMEVCERIADEIVARDVDALIPSKLDPAQKAEFVALAKKDRSLFDAIVKGLPERKVLGQVMPPASSEKAAPVASNGKGEEFAALLGTGEDGENAKALEPTNLVDFLGDGSETSDSED